MRERDASPLDRACARRPGAGARRRANFRGSTAAGVPWVPPAVEEITTEGADSITTEGGDPLTTE
jgi:hypothetical protein